MKRKVGFLFLALVLVIGLCCFYGCGSSGSSSSGGGTSSSLSITNVSPYSID